MNEVATVQQPKSMPLKMKLAKIFAIVCFALVFSTLIAAGISDIVVFGKQILAFVLAILGGAVAFIFGIICMLFSIILIFGIYLLEEYGFWPVNWAAQVFNEIIHEGAMTSGQAFSIIIVRIVILGVCLIAMGLAIAALVLASLARKEDKQRKQRMTYSFSIITIIFGAFGLMAAAIVIVLMMLFL